MMVTEKYIHSDVRLFDFESNKNLLHIAFPKTQCRVLHQFYSNKLHHTEQPVYVVPMILLGKHSDYQHFSVAIDVAS